LRLPVPPPKQSLISSRKQRLFSTLPYKKQPPNFSEKHPISPTKTDHFLEQHLRAGQSPSRFTTGEAKVVAFPTNFND
jgi:hypothetical protein